MLGKRPLTAIPANLIAIKLDISPTVVIPSPYSESTRSPVDEPDNTMNSENVDAFWDAGAMGCGELVIKLRIKFQTLVAGTVFHLRAHDTGAVEDIPAWCSMTGNRLVRAAHPDYWIERKP